MALPIEEARAQLLTVNVAISDLVAGKRIVELRVGSGNFQRLYRFGDVNLETLKALQSELLQVISTYDNSKPVFRTNATIPLIVGKDLYKV